MRTSSWPRSCSSTTCQHAEHHRRHEAPQDRGGSELVANTDRDPVRSVGCTRRGHRVGGPGFHLYKWASLAFLITFRQAVEASRRQQPGPGLSPILGSSATSSLRYQPRAAASMVARRFCTSSSRTPLSGYSPAKTSGASRELKALIEDPDANADRKIWQIRKAEPAIWI